MVLGKGRQLPVDRYVEVLLAKADRENLES